MREATTVDIDRRCRRTVHDASTAHTQRRHRNRIADHDRSAVTAYSSERCTLAGQGCDADLAVVGRLNRQCRVDCALEIEPVHAIGARRFTVNHGDDRGIVDVEVDPPLRRQRHRIGVDFEIGRIDLINPDVGIAPFHDREAGQQDRRLSQGDVYVRRRSVRHRRYEHIVSAYRRSIAYPVPCGAVIVVAGGSVPNYCIAHVLLLYCRSVPPSRPLCTHLDCFCISAAGRPLNDTGDPKGGIPSFGQKIAFLKINTLHCLVRLEPIVGKPNEMVAGLGVLRLEARFIQQSRCGSKRHQIASLC